MAVSPWIALGGTARRYFNPVENITISRERYEREYGSLKARGARSFKEAAKRTPPEVRALRPSKARSYTRKPARGAERFSGLQPLTGRKSRSVAIPFHAFWDGDIATFQDDAEPYRSVYNDAIKRIQANKRIFSLQVFYSFINHLTMASGERPVMKAIDKFSVETFDEVVMLIVEHLQSRTNIEIVGLEIRVSFFDQYLKEAKAKRGLRLTPKTEKEVNRYGRRRTV